MENEITYRKANKSDLETLFNLSAEFSKFNVDKSGDYDRFLAGNWEQYFREEILESLSNKNCTVFLAQSPNDVVGYIYARYCKDCYYYIIDELFVKPEFGRRGIGEALVKLALEEGKKYDVSIRVEIFEWNKNALNFYLKQGFKTDSLVLEMN